MDVSTIDSKFNKGDSITTAQARKLMDAYTKAVEALDSLACPMYRLVLNDIQSKKDALARRVKPSTQATSHLDNIKGAIKAYPEGKLIPKDLLIQATKVILDDKSQTTLALRTTLKEAWKRWLKVEPDNRAVKAAIKKLDEVTKEKTPVQGSIDSMTTAELGEVLSKFLAQRSAKLKRLKTNRLHK